MPIDSQLGVKNETMYGTAVTVDRFFEYRSENIGWDGGGPDRIDSQGIRTGERVLASDRFAIGKYGLSGSFELEWLTAGMGWWLHHMMGTVDTSAVVDSNYTHNAFPAQIGSASGDSFTAQVNRPFYLGANQPVTFEGGKITGWELGCGVDDLLVATIDCDFEHVETGTALASASYSTAELMSFVGGTVTLEDTVTKVKRFRVRADNNLRTDNFAIGQRVKRQPTENGKRTYEWEVELDWENLTQYNRVGSLVAAGALASVVAEFRGPTLSGTATYPSMKVTIARARFDQTGAFVSGEEELVDTISGVAVTPSGDNALELDYVSTDSTP